MSAGPSVPTEESVFTWGAPPLKFGAGAADEIGFDLSQFGAQRILVITDPGMQQTGLPDRIADNIRRYGMTVEIFDGVHVEPTDDSMNKAIGYASEQGPWDGFVAVGGGSAIDTAKAVNLLTTHPGELMDYVNKPVGNAQTPPGQLKPLIAVPTTTGTGSESTAMCVLDILSLRVKTGISHWRLRPTLAVVDPLLTMTLPPEVTADPVQLRDLRPDAVRPADRPAARRRITPRGRPAAGVQPSRAPPPALSTPRGVAQLVPFVESLRLRPCVPPRPRNSTPASTRSRRTRPML